MSSDRKVQYPMAHLGHAFGGGLLLVLTGLAPAQNRGVYPLGTGATSSGVTPEPSCTYVNQLLI
jgi:hypothetical protein